MHEPQEILIPVGGISSYSSQCITHYRSTHSTGARVRLEALDSAAFGSVASQKEFDAFFDLATTRFNDFRVPQLPRLCVSCFGGMLAFLKQLKLQNALMTPRFKPVSDRSAQRLRLSVTIVRYLELLVNSVG